MSTRTNSNATMAALTLIAQNGLDAEDIVGTGKDGNITKQDVEKHLNERAEKTTEYAEGETGASHEMKETIGSLSGNGAFTDIQVRLIDEALEFLAGQDEIIAALHRLGPEQFMTGIVTVGTSDVDSAIQAVRRVMRQLTNNAYFRFVAAEREATMMAQANGGGINGIDDTRGFEQRREEFGDYPGGNDTDCTPNEQVMEVEGLHDMLNAAFVALENLKFSWMPNWKSNDLPWFGYMNGNGKYVELHDFQSACDYLDEKQAAKQEERRESKQNALAALQSLA